MKPLTEQSVKNYHKVLKNIVDIPLLEIFLNIGIELIELHPEEQYISELIEAIQEQQTLDGIEELNMKFRQVQDYHNDVIATYEDDNMFEANMDVPLPIEEVMMTLMSYQSPEDNYDILLAVLMDATEAVSYEYGFMDEFYEMKEEELKEYLKQKVFLGFDVLYVNFASLLDLRTALLSEKEEDDNTLYVTAILTTINLSMFNTVRKERFKVEQKMESKKVGRNEPCPCGSGNKYKKCCAK